MKKRDPSINGFVTRRPGDKLGELHNNRGRISPGSFVRKPLHSTAESKSTRVLGQSSSSRQLGRSDIIDSLKGIDNLGIDNKPERKLSRRQRRLMKKMARKPRSKLFRFAKWLSIILLITALGVGAYTAYKLATASGNIFQGNILDIFQNQPLKEDSNGRSNFLILGTSEDDPGHGGASLTDSMLVMSVNQKNKDVYMFSVPRDLYVKYGMACNSGYSGKINEYFACSNEDDSSDGEQARLAATQKLVGDIFGLEIQYGVHVNHTVIKEVVDAVGGIDVDIQGSGGASGILDRNFDWRCNYTCYYVKYINGVHHLDGIHALFLAQARGDVAPTYGLVNSNFDREKNQQKILIAIREKALSTGTLTNLGTVTGIIDALGNNLRTNIQSKEIRTLMQVASEIKSSDIHTISLFGDDNSVVTTGYYGGASVVMPSAGIYDYSEIQNYIKKNITNDPVAREAAPILVLNGSGQSGLGKTEADKLTAAGFTVDSVDNAPDGTYSNVEIYHIGKDNVATSAKLETIFKTKVKTTVPPFTVNGNIRFVIIFGAATN